MKDIFSENEISVLNQLRLCMLDSAIGIALEHRDRLPDGTRWAKICADNDHNNWDEFYHSMRKTALQFQTDGNLSNSLRLSVWDFISPISAKLSGDNQIPVLDLIPDEIGSPKLEAEKYLAEIKRLTQKIEKLQQKNSIFEELSKRLKNEENLVASHLNFKLFSDISVRDINISIGGDWIDTAINALKEKDIRKALVAAIGRTLVAAGRFMKKLAEWAKKRALKSTEDGALAKAAEIERIKNRMGFNDHFESNYTTERPENKIADLSEKHDSQTTDSSELNDSTPFEDRLKYHAINIENTINDSLQGRLATESTDSSQELLAAMRHGILNGGKRLRPFILMESAAIFGVPYETSIHTATALEYIHAYSLIHDDLPAMDDDDLRRGQPTVHIAYDEATAILAGDGLLTMAFELLSHPKIHESAEIRNRLTAELARAAGPNGMVGGQSLDIQAEKMTLNETQIINLQAKKTGALISYACQAGAILGNASMPEEQSILEFGKLIGQAFQITDDLLDVTLDAEVMEKNTPELRRATLVQLYGVENARIKVTTLLDEANAHLTQFGKRANVLRDIAKFITTRN